jgi:crotonobetainyl-CoA:carnitine CoA-transferase CaiB-like acyl-CoA transferase
MTDGALSLLSLVLSIRQFTGVPVKRSDSILSHRYACYNTYETADRRYLSIGAVENRFWKNLCEYFNRPEYIALQYDDAKREEITCFFRKKFSEKPLEYWCDVFSGLDICWGPVRTLDEALAAPLFEERDMVVALRDKKGDSVKFLGTPVKLSDTPGAVRTLPPGYGENTAEVLREYGYSDDEIAAFEKQGVL